MFCTCFFLYFFLIFGSDVASPWRRDLEFEFENGRGKTPKHRTSCWRTPINHSIRGHRSSIGTGGDNRPIRPRATRCLAAWRRTRPRERARTLTRVSFHGYSVRYADVSELVHHLEEKIDLRDTVRYKLSSNSLAIVT